MIYIKVLRCGAYTKDQIVLVDEYLYDENLKPTNILVDDSTLVDAVHECHVRTLHDNYIRLYNIRPLVTTEELRFVKIKKLLLCLK